MNTIISASIIGMILVIMIGHPVFAESSVKITAKDGKSAAKAETKPVKKGKNYSIKLFESMTLDSGEKKQDAKTPAKKTAEKKVTKKVEPKKVVKKPLKVTPKPKLSSKTKHDTAKNSIGNIR